MKNEYKNIFNKIEPDAELSERVLDFDNKKRITFAPKKALAIAAAFALLVTGSAFGAKSVVKAPESSNKQQYSQNNSIEYSPFIVAYGKDDEGLIKNLSDNMFTYIEYQIIREDIRGKSDSEIDKLFDDIKQRYNDGQQEQSSHSFKRSVQRLDNALVGRYCLDCFDIDTTGMDLTQIKQITVKNSSSYGEMEIVSLDKHYDDNGEILYGMDENYNPTDDFMKGRSVTISGERFEKAKRINALFEINWNMSDELWQAIDADPDFDFAAINDVATFTIEFKNGTIAQTQMQINFTSDGKMTVKIVKPEQ